MHSIDSANMEFMGPWPDDDCLSGWRRLVKQDEHVPCPLGVFSLGFYWGVGE